MKKVNNSLLKLRQRILDSSIHTPRLSGISSMTKRRSVDYNDSKAYCTHPAKEPKNDNVKQSPKNRTFAGSKGVKYLGLKY